MGEVLSTWGGRAVYQLRLEWSDFTGVRCSLFLVHCFRSPFIIPTFRLSSHHAAAVVTAPAPRRRRTALDSGAVRRLEVSPGLRASVVNLREVFGAG